MANIRKRGNKFQVQVRRVGSKSFTKTFARMTEARAWARAQKVNIDRDEAEDISGEQINKYGPKSVPEEKWREVYFKRSPADSYEAKRKAFSRAKTSLVSEGLIEVNDNYYTRKER